MERVQIFLREAGAVVSALVRPAYRSLRQNTGLAVVSIVLAFGLWIFVSDAENPVGERRVNQDIPVEAVNVPSDVVVKGDLAPVRVQVRVEDVTFESLTKSDFEATVNLENLTVGRFQLPVQVRALTTRGSLRVTGVFPDKIDVELALLTSKKVPVVVQVGGDPPSGFTMGDPKPKETTTVVSGARESVDAVKQAVGSIDVTGRTDSISQAVRLEPRDENGTLVERVKLEPALTNVEIKIEQIVFSRPVVVSPVITGAPERGYSIVGESVEPATVTVSGPRQFIEEIKSIPTKPVNIDGEKDDVVKGVSLDLPEGVDISVIGGVNVTVTVKIDPGTGEVHFGVPVTAIGVGDGLAVQGTLPSVEVAITGSLPDLLRLKSSDISATVDLSGEDQGTHTVKVKITLPQGISAQRVTVTPEQIEVSLGNL